MGSKIDILLISDGNFSVKPTFLYTYPHVQRPSIPRYCATIFVGSIPNMGSLELIPYLTLTFIL